METWWIIGATEEEVRTNGTDVMIVSIIIIF